MIPYRRIITAGGTLAAAMCTGYLMEVKRDNAISAAVASYPSYLVKPKPSVSVPPVLESKTQDELSQLGLTDIVHTSTMSKIPTMPAEPATAPLNGQVSIPVAVAAPTGPETDCEISISAIPSFAATADVTLSAPCQKDERFTIHHSGLMFTALTDARGYYHVQIPALSKKAVIIAAFANGEGAMTQIDVPMLEYYDRVAVQWGRGDGIQLHAREFGADYGDDGHVWAQSTQGLSTADDIDGGILLRLGDAALPQARLAEVYTFPSGIVKQSGDVALSVEIAITEQNCDRDLEAQSLQLLSGEPLKVRSLSLTAPECGAVGDFLVLKNLLQDLKLASK